MTINFLEDQLQVTTEVLGTLQVYINCEFSEEFAITESPQVIDYTLASGVYKFVLEADDGNTTVIDTYFTAIDKCKVAESLCNRDTYYYYTALELLKHCPTGYEKACDIFSELSKLINNECLCL